MEDERTGRDRKIIILAVVLSLLLVGSCFAIPYLLSTDGSSSDGERSTVESLREDGVASELEQTLLDSDAYVEAQEIVEDNYVEEVDGEELLSAGARGIRRLSDEGADEEALVERGITAMIDFLDDPFSGYMDEEELAMLDTQLSGSFFGIGAAMEMVKNEVRVQSVLEGTPAEGAGLLEGDIVKEVDGEDVSGMSLTEVVGLIRGEEGTTVRIGVVRPPSSDLKGFDIVRGRIEIPVIETELKEGGVGYLLLTDWTEGVDEKLAAALADLSAQGAESLVVDLRLNGGGYMEPAISAADMFLRDGMIVSSQGRVLGTTKEYTADADVLWDLPVVILVNRGTASASEIFSAALRENGRAILVGETTFGKGVIQKIFRNDDGSGVRLTIARYYTPDGTSIDDEGLAPDIFVKNPVVGEEDLQLQAAAEAASSGL